MITLNNIPINSNWNDIASKLNSNFTTLNQEVTSIANSMSVCKGIFQNYSLLTQTVPHPLVGQYAYVVDYTEIQGDPVVYEINGFTQYLCLQEGTWSTGSHVDSLGEDIDLTGYVTASTFDTQIGIINTNLSNFQSQTSSTLATLSGTSSQHENKITQLEEAVFGVPSHDDVEEIERTVAYKSDVAQIEADQSAIEGNISSLAQIIKLSTVNLNNLASGEGSDRISNYEFLDNTTSTPTILNNVASWGSLKERIQQLHSYTTNSNITWVFYGSIGNIGYVVVMMPGNETAQSSTIYCITAAPVSLMNNTPISTSDGVDLGIKKLVWSGITSGYIWVNLIQVMSESEYETLDANNIDNSLIYFTTE